MRTRSWHLAAALALLVLLAFVATLQYRWLGDVSRAERDRLQASLKARATEFGASLDGDVTRAFAAFEIDASQFDADPVAAVTAAADRAARESATGTAVKAIFIAEPGADGVVRRLNTGARTLEQSSWPPELAALGSRLASSSRLAVAGVPLPPGFMGDAIDGDAPALIVPITAPEPPLPTGRDQVVVRRLPPRTSWHALVVWLDRERLGSQLVAPLAARHFGDAATSDFNLSVVSRRSGQPVFRSSTVDVSQTAADLSIDVFALTLADLHWSRAVAPPPGVSGPAKTVQDRVAVTIVRRGGPAPDGELAGAGGAAWRLLVQARRGSLDAIVARSRVRNLVVSLGVLGILGASLALILLASAREQRIARQQLEFVAAVSHELRTPLAVIRSAGENLADGVVTGEQVATYGALIRSEGRRLSDMVERVMDFAGMTSGTLIRARRQTDLGALVASIVSALRADADERGLNLRVHAAPGLPLVHADPDAVRSALQNAVGNALKYSSPGSEVDIDVASTARTLRVTVSDRGIGIDREDLPHVFTPFFRGRRAVDAQIRGSGVGLSLVKKIIEAHGGEVRIAARDDGGTVLTMELPVDDVPAKGPAV